MADDNIHIYQMLKTAPQILASAKISLLLFKIVYIIVMQNYFEIIPRAYFPPASLSFTLALNGSPHNPHFPPLFKRV